MGTVYQSMRCYTTIALQVYSEVLQWSAYWKPKAVDRNHAPTLADRTTLRLHGNSVLCAARHHSEQISSSVCTRSALQQEISYLQLMASRRADSTGIEMQTYNSQLRQCGAEERLPVLEDFYS